MLPLTQTVINRIQTAREIPQEISNILTTHHPINSIDLSAKANRAILKFLSNTKKRQKQRVNIQGESLSEIKNLRFLTTSTIEQVYSNTLEVFAFYDQSFRCENEAGKGVDQSLKNLYLSFFYKYQSKISAKYIFKMISHHITESTPFILLGWVSEWSRNYFNEQLQIAMQNQISRHQQQVRKANNNFMAAARDKISTPVAFSNLIMRTQQSVEQKLFTNKQSVYGLFLDQLIQYYRLLPLDLDFNFLKAMRKVHSKGNKLEVQQHLRQAAQILIQCKNKNIRQQIKQYRTQYISFLKTHSKQPKQQKYAQSKQKQKKPNNSVNTQQKISKGNSKKPTYQQRFFDRVKSQSKEEDCTLNQLQKRKSLLLYPKANKICFQSSQQIMKKIHYEKEKRVFELPLIHHSNRILSDNIRSSILKNKGFSPINRSIISNYQKGIIRHFVLATKKSEVRTTSVQKPEKISSSQHAVRQIVQNVHLKKLKGDKRKRKLMLQILREKNKNVFLDQ